MGTKIHGLDAQTYQQLATEDQNAIRERAAEQPQQTAAPEQTPPVDRLRPEDAQTPQEAVQAIHALPLPDTSGLAGLPSYAQEGIYRPRAEQFNRTRREAAEAALERFKPQRSDFEALDGATADYEYRAAMSAYESNPYVRELQRIVTESTENPTTIPSYLTNGNRTANTQQLSFPQMRDALARLDVNLPENASPEQIQAGYELLNTVPSVVLGSAINPGMQVNFSTPVAGVGTSSLLPARVNTNLTFEGEVELSDVYTGVNFQQTQQFEMTAQLQGEADAGVGRTPLNRMYAWADRLRVLSPEARSLVEGSPLLRNVVRGSRIPSASYEQFTGARLSYEAVVTPEQGARLADGDFSAAPNPLAPFEMPVGSSVLIRGESLTGSAFEASYRALTVSGSNTELSGVGFGVRRLEDSIVEVYTGPIESVENQMFLGANAPLRLASAGIDVESSSSLQRMSVARIDLSTSEGQAAYQEFMSTGRVPGWSPPAVTQAGTSGIFTHEDAVRLGMNVGPWSAAVGNGSHATVTRNVWEDGSIEQQNTVAATPDHTADISFRLRPDGSAIESETRWRIVLGNRDPELAAYLQNAFTSGGRAEHGDFDGNQHAQMTFTSDQLMQLRSQARDFIYRTEGQEMLDAIDSGSAAATTLEHRLAVAQTPDEVFQVLSEPDQAGSIAQMLQDLRFETGNAVAGQLQIRDAG